MGIGTTTPTQPLDINGTARLRNVPSLGGTVMLTADNDGVIRQQALPVASAPIIFSTATSAGVTLTPANWTSSRYTGTSITIPANSKYIVQCFELLIQAPPTPMPNGQGIFLVTSFSDSAATFAYSPDIQGGRLISGSWSSGAPFGLLTGSIILNNTTSAAKTYYYWTDRMYTNGYTGNLDRFAASVWNENQLYAIPAN